MSQSGVNYDFKQQINDLSQFDTYIQPLWPACSSIVYHPDTQVVTLTFPSALSSQDQQTLQQQISAYSNPMPVIPYLLKCSGMDSKTTSNTTWTTMMTSAYQGQLVSGIGVLVEFRVRSYLSPNLVNDSSSTNFWYDLQVIDDNNTVVASGRFSNSTSADCSLPVSAAPVNPMALRLQCRKGTAGAVVNLIAYCGVYSFP